MEGRGTATEIPEPGNAAETQGSTPAYNDRQRIALRAQQDKTCIFTALHHLLTPAALMLAFEGTRKNGASGIDGQTADQYSENLIERLHALHDRAKSGCYRAPPVKRAYIPKANGDRRPIGIPTFEDRVLQRAVLSVLETVYEQDFHDCSHGFRRGRGAHSALQALHETLERNGGGYVIELDIRAFFDTMDKAELMRLLHMRINDGVIVRLIGKWLNAGVLEDGKLHTPEHGTPQGGVISPLLANIYLHHVLDHWFETEIKPSLLGRATLVRYADDAVIVCSSERDAERLHARLPERFAAFGLQLHPKKTRRLAFAPKAGTSFDFLGFTHYWRRTVMGRWTVARKTAKDRFARSVKALKLWCKKIRHADLAFQHERMRRKLLGHYGYYGITGNIDALKRFRYLAIRLWCCWLGRRSQRKCSNLFEWLERQYPLPYARIVHRHV